MFTNFNDTFKNRKGSNSKIPREILNFLNKKIPSEFEYKEIKDGICIIIPKNGQLMKISTIIKLPEIPQKIQSQIKNIDALYEYLYRTQKRCEITPDGNGNIKINNIEININNFIRNVITNKSFKKIELVPESFPKAIEINIKAGNIVKTFSIERMPYESMDTIYLKSVEDKPISINLYINNNTTVDFNISIDISKTKEVKEIVEVCEFYRSFLDGDISLDNSRIDDIKYKKEPKNIFINEKISFWKKVLDVESVFNKKFNACQFNEKDDYLVILRLYKSLIEKKPYKIPEKITSISFNTKGDYDKCKEMIKTKMLIEFEREVKEKIFGEEIHFFVLERIYNCRIKDILEENDKMRITFDDYQKNDTFVVRKCFLSKNELKNERELNEENQEYINADTI